jgi:SAM-dependent methyltransferase
VENKYQIKDHATEFLDDKVALEIEDTLWWKVGRRLILDNFLKQARQETAICQILEIGCGSGGDLNLLAKYGAVTGVERSPIILGK